jgi:hypothetical protein
VDICTGPDAPVTRYCSEVSDLQWWREAKNGSYDRASQFRRRQREVEKKMGVMRESHEAEEEEANVRDEMGREGKTEAVATVG